MKANSTTFRDGGRFASALFWNLADRQIHRHRALYFDMADIQSIIKQLEDERTRIDAAITALRGLKSPTTTAKTKTKASRARVLSPEARAKISAAQKKRWAKARKG